MSRKLLFLIVSLAILQVTYQIANSQSGWNRQSVNTIQNLWNIYFLNDNTGWIVGDSSIILTTTDAGLHWTKKTTPNIGTFWSVNFFNESTGLIGGFVNNNHYDGFILRTTNGGYAWDRYNISNTAYNFCRYGNDTIWASTHTGDMMRSTNKGITWNSYDVFSGCELYSLSFINSSTGWTGGGVYHGDGYIFRTTNAGITWFEQYQPLYSHIYKVHFLNNSTGYAVALFGFIFKTINGGLDWNILESGIHYVLFDIYFPNANTGYAAGDNSYILKTTNSGTSWVIQPVPSNVPPTTSFRRVYFNSPSTGWALGFNGILLRTTNGGDPIGIRPISNNVPKEYYLSQNYPNPFNPSTNIEFNISKSTNMKLIVYDINGKQVEQLIDEYLEPGTYRYNFHPVQLSSGIYFYKMITDLYSETKRMILIK